MSGLKSSDIHWVVQSYIGTTDGYLGDLTYRSHREFYPAYCDVEVDPDSFPGRTTREKFLSILAASEPRIQAAILRGVVKKYPPGSEHQRTPPAAARLMKLAQQCVDTVAVGAPCPEISSHVVEHALRDAQTLLDSRGPVSALDRVHTALHGYLKAACLRESIDLPPDVTTSQVFKQLKQHHPALSKLGQHQESLLRVVQAMSTTIDALNQLRNRASLAHANEDLLSPHDAVLAINAARTLIQFLDAKFCEHGE